MDLPFKSIALSTIVHATESEGKLKKAIGDLIPERVEIEKEEVEGHYGDPKVIISVSLTRRPDMRLFWDQILNRLEERTLDWLKENALDLVSDDCRLYLRFDKQLLISDGELRYISSGDVIHVRLNVSAYPAKKKIAVDKVKKFVNSDFKYG